MAYEVIKRVSGRAYRYRVESYRDPVTRRVRGKWTYLGRVEGEGTLSPERQARPSSRERLLDAVERLLQAYDLPSISTGMVASEAGLAYGTFYRHFRDLAHVVRDAMIRETMNVESLTERLEDVVSTRQAEREKLSSWVRESIDAALTRSGLFRAWLVTSNHDPAVAAERQKRFDSRVARMSNYIERMQRASISDPSTSPEFNAYAILALVNAAAREAAMEKAFSADKFAGIIGVVHDLAGVA